MVVDVALVQMPYSAVCRPSLALSLLKVYLAEEGIDARVVYGNLIFAEAVGLDLYRLIEDTSATRLVGEWTFGAAAFPDFEPDHDAFFAHVSETLRRPLAEVLSKAYPGLRIEDVLHLIRDRATQTVETLADAVLELSPRIVGCSSVFQQHCASLALLRAIKQRRPEVVTMLGGANCEGPMGRETHRAFPWVDFVASGEADAYIGGLCRELIEGGPDIPAADLPFGVWGPCHRTPGDDRDGTPANKSDRAVIRDLDSTAVPDFSDYFDRLERSPIQRYVYPGLPVETSRGCWWGEKQHCTFCGLNGSSMAFRSKSAERTLDELATLADRYETHRIGVVDNILDMSFVRSVLPTLAEAGAPYALFYEVKPNLRREHLELFAEAGLRWIQPGIESMHTELLQLLRKGSTGVQNVQLLKWAIELGVRVSWNNLCGAPGEKPSWFQEMAAWLPQIVHLQPPSGISPIHFDRFSPYHFDAENFGLELEPLDEYRYIYPLAPENLDDLAYFFQSKRAPSEDDAPLPSWIAEIAAMIKWWHKSFWSAERPICEIAEDDGATLVIRDSRPRRAADEHRVHGLEAEILRSAQDAVSPKRLSKRLGLDDASARPVIEKLIDAHLLLHLDGRLLTLPTQPPVRPLPTFEDAPTGMMNDAAIVRDFIGKSQARQCMPSPLDLPLTAFANTKKPTSEGRVDG